MTHVKKIVFLFTFSPNKFPDNYTIKTHKVNFTYRESHSSFYHPLWFLKFEFKIKVNQIDGGSEFKDQFEEECRKRKILLFVNPPHCPELNGHVEQANRTHREEFYEVYDVDLCLQEHSKQLEEWEHIYNHIRPHQTLDYFTPYQYYRQWKRNHRQKALPM